MSIEKLRNATITKTIILNIDIVAIPQKLVTWLNGNADYRDYVLTEHLYAITTLEDYLQENVRHHEHVQYLLKIMADNGASYLRFIDADER